MVPEGWRTGVLADVVDDLVAGVSVNSEDRTCRSGELGVLKTSAVTYGVFDPSAHKVVLPEDVNRTQTPVRADRIVLSRMNTVNLVGASAYVHKDHPDLFLPDRLWLVEPKGNAVHMRWLAFALADGRSRRVLSERASGTSGSMKNLPKAAVLTLPLCFPPLAEQRRIAAVLQAADDAVAAAEAVIDQTEKVKRGLVEQLLTRGMPGRHTRFKMTEIGEVPESWEVVPLEAIAQVRTGIAKGKKDLSQPIQLPYLRVANVQDGHIDLTEVKTIEVEPEAVERYRLRKGDVLMTEGGDLDKLGRGDVWDGSIDPCLHQNHVFAVRAGPKLLPQFLAAFGGSVRGKKYFLNCAKQTTNLASINSTQLKGLPIPCPTITEQSEIVQRFATVASAKLTAGTALSIAANVRQALMSDLLSGRVRVSA